MRRGLSKSAVLAGEKRCVYFRIESIIQFLRYHTPSSKVLLVGLTPRGVWSEDSREFEWPSVFTVPINALNHIMRRLSKGDDFVHYVDCGDTLLSNGKASDQLPHSSSQFVMEAATGCKPRKNCSYHGDNNFSKIAPRAHRALQLSTVLAHLLVNNCFEQCYFPYKMGLLNTAGPCCSLAV